jgi:very-short-patch-repair endonuclease|tara:strand:- start:1006 stop:1770 length:765 start_codon:yes stop_codon:yes gene_type:complete
MNEFDQKVIDMYNNKNLSTYEIAKVLETYPNKIRRTLIKHGQTLKNKSEAQKVALKEGRSSHPTMGKQRSKEERLKISSGLVDYWQDMSDKERSRRVKIAKRNWKKMSAEQKESMRSKGIAAIRAAATEGSKLEKFIQGSLEKQGFFVKMHETIIPAENLEIDLYIPELKTIIEVDGPSHFLPIWGDDKLQKQINADLRKSGALLSRGYAVIRVKSLGQESLSKKEELIQSIVEIVTGIRKKFPPRSKRFIEVE